ncbi:MAG: Mth938-like domain-containing protein [Desulforhopalus sp.]
MKKMTTTSPKILSSGWGKMDIENLGSGKDFKLWPGGGKSWDWSEHGTSHSGGVQKDDVLELIDNDSRVVILTTGMLKRLKVPAATVELLREHGIEVIVVSTKKGIQLYNDYVAKGTAVGGLFHTTC